MVIFTVIDGKTRRVDCFPEDCPYFTDAELVRDFIDKFSEELSIKDLYFITYNRDELHYEAVQLALQSYAYNQSSFEKAQDHTC